jgi:hypothetical protein
MKNKLWNTVSLKQLKDVHFVMICVQTVMSTNESRIHEGRFRDPLLCHQTPVRAMMHATVVLCISSLACSACIDDTAVVNN